MACQINLNSVPIFAIAHLKILCSLIPVCSSMKVLVTSAPRQMPIYT